MAIKGLFDGIGSGTANAQEKLEVDEGSVGICVREDAQFWNADGMAIAVSSKGLPGLIICATGEEGDGKKIYLALGVKGRTTLLAMRDAIDEAMKHEGFASAALGSGLLN